MPKFAANLTMLFNEHDFLDRFQAAAEAGFKGVEYLFPYAYDKQQLTDKLQQHGLTQVLHNLPAGDWDGGERGIAILPERVGEFQDGVGRAIRTSDDVGLARGRARTAHVVFHHIRTNEPWCRDHGPIFIVREQNGRRERAVVDWG